MIFRTRGRRIRALLLAIVIWAGAAHAATVNLVVLDDPNEGLNSGIPVDPVAGNQGQTLGEQRQIALQYAADILGSRVSSTVPIRIAAKFDDRSCSRSAAELGSAAPALSTANFAGAARDDTFYPIALANAQHGSRLRDTLNDINAVFNSTLDDGNASCLRGSTWYYGLDGRTPSGQVSFVSTAVHELIHGLGFISLVALQDTANIQAGQFPATASSGVRLPDIYSSFIQDLSFSGQPLWPDLSDAQRRQSLTHGPDVVWSDANTSSRAMTLLDDGFNQGRVKIYAPSPLRPGSSISHWDTSLDPDQVMEPVATGRDRATNGIGMAACVLENIGWQLINGTRCPDVDSATIAGSPGDDNRGIDSVNAVDAASPASLNVSDGNDNESDDDGGGGGCTLAADALFDPIWFVLLLMAAAALRVRRVRRR